MGDPLFMPMKNLRFKYHEMVVNTICKTQTTMLQKRQVDLQGRFFEIWKKEKELLSDCPSK